MSYKSKSLKYQIELNCYKVYIKDDTNNYYEIEIYKLINKIPYCQSQKDVFNILKFCFENLEKYNGQTIMIPFTKLIKTNDDFYIEMVYSLTNPIPIFIRIPKSK